MLYAYIYSLRDGQLLNNYKRILVENELKSLHSKLKTMIDAIQIDLIIILNLVITDTKKRVYVKIGFKTQLCHFCI